jgi:hypothetical protein
MNNAHLKYRPVLKIIAVLIPLLLFTLFALRETILELLLHLPGCPIYNMYHVYCPGCGNTRCVSALLNGNILSALRFNILPILLLLFCFLGYLEFTAYSFGRHLQILPRKGQFYIVVALLLALYSIIRNFIPYLTP